jgi:hypothetical protein
MDADGNKGVQIHRKRSGDSTTTRREIGSAISGLNTLKFFLLLHGARLDYKIPNL